MLSKEEIFDVIKQFNDLGIYFFIITGGEPFVYPYLFDVLEHFKDSYFLIYTNGTLVTEENAKRWLNSVIQRLLFQLRDSKK